VVVIALVALAWLASTFGSAISGAVGSIGGLSGEDELRVRLAVERYAGVSGGAGDIRAVYLENLEQMNDGVVTNAYWSSPKGQQLSSDREQVQSAEEAGDPSMRGGYNMDVVSWELDRRQSGGGKAEGVLVYREGYAWKPDDEAEDWLEVEAERRIPLRLSEVSDGEWRVSWAGEDEEVRGDGAEN
jgi:hypothetical protein